MAKTGSVTWDEGAGPAPNARRILPGLVAAYFGQGRQTLARNPQPAEFHALRLATKRLRYILELFRPCYGPAFRARLAALHRLQQLLGEVNDCAAAAAVLREAAGRKSAQLPRLEEFLRRRGFAKTEEFRREWTQAFDAPGQERWWTTYLARQARTPGRKP